MPVKRLAGRLNRSALVLALLEIAANGGVLVAHKYIADADWSAWAAHSILSVSIALGVVHRRGAPDAPRKE